jgi:hypothetical protein
LPLPFCSVFARSSFLANCPCAWSFLAQIFLSQFPVPWSRALFRLRFRIFAFCTGARRLIIFAAAVSLGQATRHATTAASEAYAAAPALQSCLEFSDSPARFRLVVISVVVSSWFLLHLRVLFVFSFSFRSDQFLWCFFTASGRGSAP